MKTGGQGLAEGQTTPHILVEADIEFTEHLWRGSSVKPFVLSPNYHASGLRDALTDAGDLYASRLPAMNLMERLLRGGADQDALDNLKGVLKAARSHFGRARGTLNVAVVGSHTSITDQIIVGYKNDGGDITYLIKRKFLLGMRKNRILARLLGATLERLWRVRLIWLAEAFPELRPSTAAPDRSLVQLAAIARSALAQVPVESETEWKVALQRRALPLIYVRETPAHGWRPLETGSNRDPYSVTDALIGQFARVRSMQPGLQGVLVKVLPEDESEYSPVDPPVVGDRTLEVARVSGLSAILLDRRFGIVRPCGLNGPNVPPIYAV